MAGRKMGQPNPCTLTFIYACRLIFHICYVYACSWAPTRAASWRVPTVHPSLVRKVPRNQEARPPPPSLLLRTGLEPDVEGMEVPPQRLRGHGTTPSKAGHSKSPSRHRGKGKGHGKSSTDVRAAERAVAQHQTFVNTLKDIFQSGLGGAAAVAPGVVEDSSAKWASYVAQCDRDFPPSVRNSFRAEVRIALPTRFFYK